MTTKRSGYRVAVVGAGPAGCYTAQFLAKHWPDVSITILDTHTAPHGLIRFGVAPDHLGTKAIAKQFDRLFARENVEFCGSTEVGRDVTLEQLRAANHAVVLATGLWGDRRIEDLHRTSDGKPLKGIYGSGTLTRLINGHPGETADSVEVGKRTVVVGAGNVAMDIVRLMLTPPESLADHGVAKDVIKALTGGPITHIDVVCRALAPLAKFDVSMVKELADLPDVKFTSDLAKRTTTPADDQKSHAIRALEEGSPETAGRTVDFHFGWVPQGVSGYESVDSIHFRAADESGDVLTLATDSVCTAIGFTDSESTALRRDELLTADGDIEKGRLADGLYCVGWFRRGPTGTIPTNRADAKAVASTIISDLKNSPEHSQVSTLKEESK